MCKICYCFFINQQVYLWNWFFEIKMVYFNDLGKSLRFTNFSAINKISQNWNLNQYYEIFTFGDQMSILFKWRNNKL